jgi:hypothetical protein
MNILVRVVTGVIQDADNDSYDRVTIVYVTLSAASLVVSIVLLILSKVSVDLGRLQWTRRQRMANGALINDRNEKFHKENGNRNRKLSMSCFIGLVFLVLGSWCGYFWGVATGNNG